MQTTILNILVEVEKSHIKSVDRVSNTGPNLVLDHLLIDYIKDWISGI